jgi:hypothetical protein
MVATAAAPTRMEETVALGGTGVGRMIRAGGLEAETRGEKIGEEIAVITAADIRPAPAAETLCGDGLPAAAVGEEAGELP